MSLRDTMPATLAHTLAHAFDGWRDRFAAARAWHAEVARTEAELATYSDRELMDLGISAADIPALAREQANRSLRAR